MGARMAENVCYYIFTIVITTYVTTQLGLGKSFALNAVLIGAAVHFVTIPMWGALSDRIGRQPVYLLRRHRRRRVGLRLHRAAQHQELRRSR